MRTCTLMEAAAILNITRITLRNWMEEGCPAEKIEVKRGRGVEYRVDVGAVMRWREKRALDSMAKDAASVDLEEGKRRKVVAEAMNAELDVAIKQGKYVAIEVAAKVVGDALGNVRMRLLAAGATLAPRLVHLGDAHAGRIVIDSYIDDTLRELSGIQGAGDEIVDSPGGGIPGELEAAPAVDDLSMVGPVPQTQPGGKRRTGAVVDSPS